jgi:hypothetical protein
MLRALFCVRYNRAQRIQRLRWQLGAVLPEDVRDLLHPSEKELLKSYSDILGSYMTNVDLDLTVVMLLNCTMCISISLSFQREEKSFTEHAAMERLYII